MYKSLPGSGTPYQLSKTTHPAACPPQFVPMLLATLMPPSQPPPRQIQEMGLLIEPSPAPSPALSLQESELIEQELIDGDSTTQNNWMYCLAEPPCRDENSSCGSWASSGECALNPSYMLGNCMVSCGTCPALQQPELPALVSVSSGSFPTEVSWSLDCDGLGTPIAGGAPYSVAHTAPLGICTLTMADSYGDGWDGAEWSAPGWTDETYSISGPSGSVSFSLTLSPPPLPPLPPPPPAAPSDPAAARQRRAAGRLFTPHASAAQL